MKEFRGIYGILTAPYNQRYELDEADVRSQVEYCVKGGSHGIVVPVNASEFVLLTDEERDTIVRVTVERTAGRIPVIAGVAAPTTFAAVRFARFAKQVGADGVIAMPPYMIKATMEEIVEYYRAIADACEKPVFIQNYIPPVGTPLSAEACVEIMRSVEGVQYVKEETELSGHVITRIAELAKTLPEGRYKGTMGGKACRYLIDEFRRGACGCMPACEVVDIQAQVWNLLDKGEQEKAEALYEKVVPLLNMEYMFGYAVYKEVLRRRGVIKTALTRAPGNRGLDALDHVELDRVLKMVEPHFAV
jgi:4-hydroxy-tetrahydrodipicolinate synthase